MNKKLNTLRQLFSQINFFCACLGAVLLFGIAAIICLEVITRALGGASQLWVIEVSEYALLFITFLGAPYLLEKNMHVVIDLVVNNISHKPKLWLQGLNASIGFLVCITLTIVGIMVVIEQYQVGVREITVMRPLSWWITAALPLGTGLMSIQFLDQIIRSFQSEEI